jgi:hypothetical protein
MELTPQPLEADVATKGQALLDLAEVPWDIDNVDD